MIRAISTKRTSGPEFRVKIEMSSSWRGAQTMRVVPLALVLALVLAACGGSSGSSSPPGVASAKFVPSACPSRVASSPAFADAHCGQLIVPENRNIANGKAISISVAIIPSITQPPQHEPLFYITGGPGGDAMGDVEFLVPALNQTQDLVVSAQRGTLDATPALLCPEIDAFNAQAVGLVYDAPSTGTLHVAATKACHDRSCRRESISAPTTR
jgi:hypothetical protein